MSLYCIGDVQGCDAALGRLLDALGFSPSRDTIFVLGDLVNRGPDSRGVLHRLIGYGASARCLLGNHDLHLLAVAHGARKRRRSETIADILDAPDREPLLDWLRQQDMAFFEQGVLMVHAGVLPAGPPPRPWRWRVRWRRCCAGRTSPASCTRCMAMSPPNGTTDCKGKARLRVIVNALTRLRFCTAEGVMEFATKEGVGGTPPGFMPWFDVPGRRTADVTVAFGHWSTLGWLNRPDVISLDSGCVWGGHLSAIRLDDAGAHELIQVKCPQLQKPAPGK